MSAQFASASDLVPAFDDEYPLNYFPFTELNSSRPRLVAAVCQDLKKINSAETILGNMVYRLYHSVTFTMLLLAITYLPLRKYIA